MTTSSLKTHLAPLARTLNLGEASLYERQRALVREGLLESIPGQGRGSGVRASPDSLAVLLISLLSSVSLTEAAALTRDMVKAKPVGGKCPLTGATNLRDAVAAFLSNPARLDRVTRLSISGLRGTAEIGFRRNQVSKFEGRASENQGVRFTLSLSFDEMPDFNRIVRDIFQEDEQ